MLPWLNLYFNFISEQEVSGERKKWSLHCSVMSSSASRTRFNLLTSSFSARYVMNDSFANVKCALPPRELALSNYSCVIDLDNCWSHLVAALKQARDLWRREWKVMVKVWGLSVALGLTTQYIAVHVSRITKNRITRMQLEQKGFCACVDNQLFYYYLYTVITVWHTAQIQN